MGWLVLNFLILSLKSQADRIVTTWTSTRNGLYSTSQSKCHQKGHMTHIVQKSHMTQPVILDRETCSLPPTEVLSYLCAGMCNNLTEKE